MGIKELGKVNFHQFSYKALEYNANKAQVFRRK